VRGKSRDQNAKQGIVTIDTRCKQINDENLWKIEIVNSSIFVVAQTTFDVRKN